MNTVAHQQDLLGSCCPSVPSDVVVEPLYLLPGDVCAPLQVVQVGVLRDVAVVGEGATDLTGLFVWPGARIFCRFLAALRCQGGTADSMRRVWGCSGIVELGGGVGLGAFSAALLWTDMDCWVTDILEAALILAAMQREKNSVELRKQRSNVSFGILDWEWVSAASRAGDDSHAAHHMGNVESGVESRSLALLSPAIFDAILCGSTSVDGEHAPLASTDCAPQPWIVGLDIVYPDHSDHNMGSLVGCLSSALQSQQKRGASLRDHIFSQQCTLLFIDRDVGVTLRRLILCASEHHLVVTPLVCPFSSCSRETSFEWAAERFATKGVALGTTAESSWERLERSVLESIACDALTARVSSGGEWLLMVSLPPPDWEMEEHPWGTKRESLSASARSPTGTAAVRKSVNSRWVTALPWLWPPTHRDEGEHIKTPTRWEQTTVPIVAGACVACNACGDPSVRYAIDWEHPRLQPSADTVDDMYKAELMTLMMCDDPVPCY